MEKNKSASDLQINKSPKSNTSQTERIPNYSQHTKSNSDRNELPPPLNSDSDSDDTDNLLHTPLLGGISKQNHIEN